MLAEITFDQLSSGFIGSLFGFALATVGIYLKARHDSKTRLRTVLLKLGRILYTSQETPAIIEEHYDAIMDACADYHARLISPWGRSKLRRLWYGLIGHDQASLARFCHCAPQQLDAINHTESLLRFIGYGYPARPRA